LRWLEIFLCLTFLQIAHVQSLRWGVVLILTGHRRLLIGLERLGWFLVIFFTW